MMNYRHRIRSLQWVGAEQLVPRSDNWGVHNAAQRNALRGALRQLGVIDAVIARELTDGSGRYEVIDGHLRLEELAGQEVPVLVVDLDDEESRLALATLDAIAAARETDAEALARLLEGLTIDDAELMALVKATANAPDLVDQAPVLDVEEVSVSIDGNDDYSEQETPSLVVPTSYALTVECRDADDQRALFESLRADGRKVKVLTI